MIRFRFVSLSVALAVLTAAALAGAPTRAASLIEKNFWLSGPNYEGTVEKVPLCHTQHILNMIATQFHQREAIYWNSSLLITGFDRFHQIAMQPWGPDYIPRRFCSARAFLNDGHERAVYYSVIEDGGIIGADEGVEWCVTGLDRHRAFAPNCKMARP